MTTLMDLSKKLFGSDRGFAQASVGSRSQGTTVRHGTAQEDSTEGRVTVLLDGSVDAVVLVCDVPVVKGQRVSVAYSGGTYKVVSVGKVVEIAKGAAEAVAKAVVSTTDEYALSDSSTVPPTQGWSIRTPEWVPGKYIWRRVTTVYGDGTVVTGSPALMTGNPGSDGKSAYELALEGGFEGDRDAWLRSLVGKDGEDGIPGSAGEDGKTTYVHIAYGTSLAGANFSTTWFEGATHLGTYTDFTQADSRNPALYTWALIKGADGSNGKSAYELALEAGFRGSRDEWLQSLVGKDGQNGIPGNAGEDGRTTYLHIAYATSLAGANFNTVWFEGATHLGTCTDFAQGDPIDPSAYTWALIKGADGRDGENGVGIRSTEIRYLASASGTTIPSGTWQEAVPSVPSGWYLWTRTVIRYTDGSQSVSYSVSRIGQDGGRGEDGEDGRTVYATSSTAANDPAKIAKLVSGEISLFAGLTVAVKFEHENTAASPTLNVGGTGAKPVYTNGAPCAYWEKGATVIFVCNGSSWHAASSPVYASTVTVGNPAARHVFIDSDSVDVNAGGTTVASFGETTVIGKPAGQVLQLTDGGLDFLYQDQPRFSIEALAGTTVLDSSTTSGMRVSAKGGIVLIPHLGSDGYTQANYTFTPQLMKDYGDSYASLSTSSVKGASILYWNGEGTTGTVTLRHSAANFDFLEIAFTDGKRHMTQRVFSPDGKSTVISRAVWGGADANYYYDNSAILTISGKSIEQSNKGRFYTNATKAYVEQNEGLKITHVFGWR